MMGYNGGGLGKNEQGIVAPIVVKLRPNNMGMGYNDYKEQELKEKQKVPEALALPNFGGRTKEKLWSKKNQKYRPHYSTVEELLAKKQEQGGGTSEVFVQQVFNMQATQVRVSTNLENLNAEEEDIPMPKLQHNVSLLVDLAEVDIQKIDRDLRIEKETAIRLKAESEKLKVEASRAQLQIDKLEGINGILGQLGERIQQEL